ncbi:MAG TPA: hypothetical protein VGV92_08510 [Gammaproteobacteria bacterium]|nr:hypothetical protein [Gammaproteobacteria bacterium]
MKLLTVVASLAALTLTTSVFAESNNCEQIIKNFPGTYTMVKRTLSDGTVLKGSQVQGTLLYGKDGYSSVTITVRDAKNGTYDMAALQTDYSISSTTFTNKLKAMALQFGKPTSPVKYTFDGSKLSSPVVCDNGTLDLKNPADYPLSDLRITAAGILTAIHSDPELKGAIDEWKRIG